MPAFSGLFGDSFTLSSDKMPSRNVMRRLALRPGFRKYRELFDTLIGAAPGSAAVATYTQIAEDSGVGGGNRTIETVSVINRNTTANDVTVLKEMTVNVDRSVYAVDLSGNGSQSA